MSERPGVSAAIVGRDDWAQLIAEQPIHLRANYDDVLIVGPVTFRCSPLMPPGRAFCRMTDGRWLVQAVTFGDPVL